MSKPVVFVDVMNLVFRSHYAHANLSSDAGQPTGVLFGVLKAIHDLRENVSKRIVFVWDHGIPVMGAPKPRNWRDDFFAGYKGTRQHDSEARPLIFSQLPDLHKVISMLGYSSVSVMGLEADDLIGILVRDTPGPVCVYSTDQDFYQLLDNRTQILVPKKDKGGFRWLTKKDVEDEFQIPINRWPEYLALGGDKSDNIKPMRGMGPKTAIKLIQSGVDLKKPLAAQPNFDKYAPVWEMIQKCYSAANIPTDWKDPRIASCLKGSKVSYKPEQFWATDRIFKDCQAQFNSFCADRDFVTILALRRQLFEKGEQPCRKEEQTPTPDIRWPRRTLGL